VVILRSLVPLVLRKVEPGQYRVVGESYVHGMMNREVIRQYELGMKEVRDTNLC